MSYYRPQPRYGIFPGEGSGIPLNPPRYGIFPGEGSGIPLLPRDGFDYGPGLQRNFQDVNTSGRWSNWATPNRDKGYGLDLNRNGRFDRGRDGILVFDMNRDGKYDKKDVRRSNNMMKAVQGNYDFNGDGYVSRREARRGNRLRGRYAQMDRNRDGVLDKREMSRAGARVWIDKSQGGGIGRNELHSVWNLPGRNGSRYSPSQRLDFVDPFAGVSGTSNNWGYGGGYYNGGGYRGGGGYPGVGGGGWAWAGGTPGFYN